MASPIGYLIHPDPSLQPQKPASQTLPGISGAPLSTPETHSPLAVTSNPAPAPRLLPTPPLASSAPEQRVARSLGGNHNRAQPLYQCADCLRRYSRPEHLQRHIASHTLGKRFTCDVCSKAFARADLLKRHRANHQDGNGNKRRRINSDPSASRVGQACTACAKARVKCEEVKPCTRCKNRGLACEVPVPEDTAAYMAHLSANRMGQGHAESTPESCCSVSSSLGQAGDPLPGAGSASFPYVQSASPEDGRDGTGTPVYAAYDKGAEFHTAEAPSGPTAHGNFGSIRSHPGGDLQYVGQEEAARVQFPDFLRDVLYDQSLGSPIKSSESQGPMLDFYDDVNLDFNEFDFNMLNHWIPDPPSDMSTPAAANPEDPVGMAEMRSTLAKIWTESPWRWTPGTTDNRFTEQPNLPLPTADANSARIHESRAAGRRVVKEALRPACRDRILAIVLSTCRESSMANRVASSFPATDTIDSWINIFLAAHMCQISSWIHYGSFSLNNQWSEWLAVAAAAGAVLTPVPAFRRFGLALQEAIRTAIPERFEENNRSITEISKVQALVLLQDVGLWCGNRRKMEIAECHLTIPIGMMRYRGRFGRSAYPDIVIHPADKGQVLEEKWKKWHQLEAWKRLVFHIYLRDAQVSMTQLNNPSMSYAELTLPLPYSKDLWFARSAEEFKARYLELGANSSRPPCLGDLFRDVNALSNHALRLDLPLAIAIFLHAFWSLIWEYRQLTSIYDSAAPAGAHANTTSLLLDSRRAELMQQLESFHQHLRIFKNRHPALLRDFFPLLLLLLHFLLFNLHAPLPDLQLFSGKEGEDQARRVYPALRSWACSADARRAMWHAAQVLKAARAFPKGTLQDFWGVAVCHAVLGVWGWGIVKRSSSSSSSSSSAHGSSSVFGRVDGGRDGTEPGQAGGGGERSVVYLDEEDNESGEPMQDPAIRAWIDHGQGRPAIHGLQRQQQQQQQQQKRHGDGQQRAQPCLFENARACAAMAQDILRANFAGVCNPLPTMTDNIIVVLKQLEKAALAVGME
ncbi:hypothetical protein VTH06DRAFT_493 [Thermothelomyces fergusii]